MVNEDLTEFREEEPVSREEARKQLYLRQKHLLEQFLQTGAISREQFEKSLGDLTEKMGMQDLR